MQNQNNKHSVIRWSQAKQITSFNEGTQLSYEVLPFAFKKKILSILLQCRIFLNMLKIYIEEVIEKYITVNSKKVIGKL